MQQGPLIAFLALIQFINILDFMMVMPLGPQFAEGLGIPSNSIGLIGGSYTLAAALAGIVGAAILDRFDRKPALVVCLFGLSVGTIAASFATNLQLLIGARIMAGFFGGPTYALVLSIVGDQIDESKRGRAIGWVMASFSIASVFGVPVGLELAKLGSWKTPFLAIGTLGLGITILAALKLPSMQNHLSASRRVSGSLRTLLRTQTTWISALLVWSILSGVFLIVPNLASYVVFNRHFQSDHLGVLYFIGGIASLVGMRISGKLVDRLNSSVPCAIISSTVLLLVMGLGFVLEVSWLQVGAVFVLFMFGSSFRMVAVTTLLTKVPEPHERAQFQSFQSTIQNLSSSIGAFVGSALLLENPDQSLTGFPRVGSISILAALASAGFVIMLERQIKRRPARP